MELLLALKFAMTKIQQTVTDALHKVKLKKAIHASVPLQFVFIFVETDWSILQKLVMTKIICLKMVALQHARWKMVSIVLEKESLASLFAGTELKFLKKRVMTLIKSQRTVALINVHLKLDGNASIPNVALFVEITS